MRHLFLLWDSVLSWDSSSPASPGWWAAATKAFEIMVSGKPEAFSAPRILMIAKFTREKRGEGELAGKQMVLCWSPCKVSENHHHFSWMGNFQWKIVFVRIFLPSFSLWAFSDGCSYPNPSLQVWHPAQPESHGQQVLLSDGPTALQKSRKVIFQAEVSQAAESFLMGSGSLWL